MELEFKEPWGQITDEQFQSIQSELEKEIGSRHPLWGLNPIAFGRNGTCDDVVVRIIRKQFAIVHLVWNGMIDQYPDKFPSIQKFESIDDLQKKINEDSFDFNS